jgi:hypothetical protein
MSLVLSDAEIVELTRKQRHGAQIRALRHLGIDHKQRADGSIMVARSHFEQLHGATNSSKMLLKELDWSKFK